MNSLKKSVAIIGASGVVGQELVQLYEKNSPEFALLKFNSSGKDNFTQWSGNEKLIQDSQYIFNCSGSELSKEILKHKTPESYFIDLSSALRMNPEIPLVVPEINFESIELKQCKTIANPNCTSILLCICLDLIKKLKLKKIQVSTYQAASGAGKAGLEELEASAQNSDFNGPYSVFKHPLYSNVMSHNSEVANKDSEYAGYNDEEIKVMQETKKILQLDDSVEINVHCMRVPVLRAHTETVSVELEEEIHELQKVIALFENQAQVKIVNDAESNLFPMPLNVEKKHEVLVGRFRVHPQNKKMLSFHLSGDQLLKGAALNAYQIFQKLKHL